MVSKIGFGGIPIQRLTEAETISLVRRCFELGINFFDTANNYTTSEERIGKAIKGFRDKIIIATKSGSRDPEELSKHLELSLKRLDVDYIDLYQFHGISDFASLDKILTPGGAMSVVLNAQSKGIVRHIGLSSHQIDVALKAVATGRFETLMFPFNFITPEAADELIPLCRKMDVGFICMKPMAGGMVDNANIAIKYLRQYPDIVPIPGIERTTEIEEIINIMQDSTQMTDAEKQEMDRIKATLGAHFCHRCDYCQPCTMKIPISTVLTHQSAYRRLHPARFFSPPLGEPIEKATECSDCGECEQRCPYHLPIRKLLKEQITWYRSLKREYEKQCTSG
jgi:predicted aldo/keto reductase-like oxidoreductase